MFVLSNRNIWVHENVSGLRVTVKSLILQTHLTVNILATISWIHAGFSALGYESPKFLDSKSQCLKHWKARVYSGQKKKRNGPGDANKFCQITIRFEWPRLDLGILFN